MKKTSFYWSLLVGAAVILWQVGLFYIRFGSINTQSGWLDYVMFFLTGVIGGLILIFFLRQQTSNKGWWIVLIAFLLAFPVSMGFLLLGGLFGYIGILLVPQIPWALTTWIGSLIGKRFS